MFQVGDIKFVTFLKVKMFHDNEHKRKVSRSFTNPRKLLRALDDSSLIRAILYFRIYLKLFFLWRRLNVFPVRNANVAAGVARKIILSVRIQMVWRLAAKKSDQSCLSASRKWCAKWIKLDSFSTLSAPEKTRNFRIIFLEEADTLLVPGVLVWVVIFWALNACYVKANLWFFEPLEIKKLYAWTLYLNTPFPKLSI